MTALIGIQMEYRPKTKKLKSICVCILALLGLAFATLPLQAQDTTEDITQRFFELYKTSYEEAVNYAYGTNPTLMERDRSGYDTLMSILNSNVPMMGEYSGYELISEKSLAGRVKNISYLLKYSLVPVRLRFTLAKNDEKWKLFAMTIDANDLEEELQQAGTFFEYDDADTPEGVTMVINKFFEKYKQSIGQAFDFAMRTTAVDDEQVLRSLEAMRTGFEAYNEDLGKFLDHEQLMYVKMADSFSFATYVAYYEQNTIRILFLMYKADENWRIERFRLYDDVQEQLEETVKIYRLN
ncbi:hypothetical protein [Maribacter sp. 2307ULW6-5]|uniref:hypothetical protein n=1 Tax=Maribacter sp. 2307ULW6-5 TaxID=3386275 RepID=UPI0039BCE4E1